MRPLRVIATVIVLGIVGVTRAPHAQGPGTGLPWTSDFETNNFSEWNGGYRSTNNLVVTTVGCDFGRCARTDIVAGTVGDNYADKLFGDWFSLGGTKVEEVWLRFYAKFSASYVWPNRSHKMAIINLTNGVDNLRRYQVYVYVTPTGVFAVDHSDIDNWQFFGLPQNVGAPVAPRPNQFDKIKLYVRLNTPGVSDGIVRMWVNDQLKLQYTTVPIRANTSFGMNKLILSASATQAAVSNGFEWWDSWVLSQVDPDTVATPPSVTASLQITP